MKTHDAIGRRLRGRPRSTGRFIKLQPRDLVWFEKLHIHGPLPVTYLHQFTRHIHTDYKRTQERLGRLYHEDRTYYGGRYLDRPKDQEATPDGDRNHKVYDLLSPAEHALSDHGRLHEQVASPHGSWPHRFMVACITASIEIETLTHPTIAFIPQHRILARAGTSLRIPDVPYLNPGTGITERKCLIPDAVFGLRYAQPDDSKRFLFFLVEADRKTEVNALSSGRKTWERTIRQYRSLIGGGVYKQHFKLTSGMFVLNVTTTSGKMQSLLDLTNHIAEGRGNRFMLFQHEPSFGKFFKPGLPRSDLLNGPWKRAGQPDLYITRP